MQIYQIVCIFYIFFSLYSIFIASVTNVDMCFYIPAMFGIWLCYIVFRLGSHLSEKKYSSILYKSRRKTLSINVKKSIIFSFIMLIMAQFYVQFYTGMNIFDVIHCITSSVSAYSRYQSYFKLNNIGSITVMHKIHWLLIGAFIFMYQLYIYIRIMLIDNKLRLLNILCLVFAALPSLYSGIARGTNVEMFYLFTILLYCLAKRCRLIGLLKNESAMLLRMFMVFCILGFVMLFVFNIVVELRGTNLYDGIVQLTNEISYDSNSIIFSTFPRISRLLGSMFGYAGWGCFYISAMFNYVVFDAFNAVFAFIFPYGFDTLLGENLENIMIHTVDVGVKWMPNLALFIDRLGYFITLIVCWIMGRYIRYLYVFNYKYAPLITYMTEYMIFLIMISLPMGEFVNFSAPKITLVMLVIVEFYIWLQLCFKRIKRTY